MRKLKWYAKQLLPLTYRSKYRDDGSTYFSVWKMWMGKVYNHDKVIVCN